MEYLGPRLGLPWEFEREKSVRAAPHPGSALHHLVTTLSVKKPLRGLLQLRVHRAPMTLARRFDGTNIPLPKFVKEFAQSTGW
jgi:hypothetical protein